MFYQEKNEYGVITIDDTFFKQVLENSIKSFNGNVLLSNSKGQIFDYIKIFGINDSNNYYEVKKTDNGYLIRVFIIVKFGSSISNIADKIFEDICSFVVHDLSLDIDNIEIIVKGIMTSKVLQKKDLVYEYKKNH